MSSLPIQPLPVHQYDGVRSHSIDHPNERLRAQHRRSSAPVYAHSTSHSQSQSHYEEPTDRSFRSGPSIESGEPEYSSSSRSSS